MTQENYSLQQKNLIQQGYQSYTSIQLKQIDMGLRFTPLTCALIALYGLYVQSPAILYFVAVLGMWAFFFPEGHPMDLFYNKIICKITGSEALPANPLQRRLACFAAGIMNTMAATFFVYSMPQAALITGGMLMLLQAIVIFTHFCTLSWMYEKILRAIGLWEKPIDLKEAKTLYELGAMVIDVRGPDEYSKKHIETAINIPLEKIEFKINELKDKTILLHCASGARSQLARNKLIENGLDKVFNLGSFSRAKSIIESK